MPQGSLSLPKTLSLLGAQEKQPRERGEQQSGSARSALRPAHQEIALPSRGLDSHSAPRHSHCEWDPPRSNAGRDGIPAPEPSGLGSTSVLTHLFHVFLSPEFLPQFLPKILNLQLVP